MTETFWFIGLCVTCIVGLAIVIPVIVGSVQFWVSMYTDFKHWRDKKAGGAVK